MIAKLEIKGKIVEENSQVTLQQAIEDMQWWFHQYAWYTKKVFTIEDEAGQVIYKNIDEYQHK